MKRKSDRYCVNVWFDSEAHASVSKQFTQLADAVEFAKSYNTNPGMDYSDCTVRVFDWNVEITPDIDHGQA